MADSVLGSAVILAARRRANDEDDMNIAQAAELLDHLQKAWKRLYSLYVKAEPDRFRTETTIALSAGAVSSTVDATWYSTLGVDYQQATHVRIPLRRLHEPERHLFNGIAPGSQHACAYRVLGNGAATALHFYPPPAAGSYVHIWVPTAPAITEASELDVRLGHDEYLELLIAKKLFEKEDAYDGRFEGDPRNPKPGTIAWFEQELAAEANLRYMHEPERTFSGFGRSRGLDEADYPRRRGF